MKNAPPLISVIISTYNRRPKLERALNSVLQQTLQDIEIIVVDNASTDNTVKFLKNIKDPRVRLIQHETNQGGSAARNTGIRAARAELIALLDDDDQWMAEKLEQQFKKIQELSANIGLVYVGTEIFDEQKQKIKQSNLPRYRGEVYPRLLLSTILGSVSSVLVKRSCFDKVGMFDEQLSSCQDWDMWLRIARYYEFDYVPQILARINMHGEQISTNFAALIPGRMRMVQKHEEEFKQYPDIFVIHLKRLGKLHCLNGTWDKAWDWFGKAIRVRKLEIIKITAWILFEWPWVKLCSETKYFRKYTI